MVTVICFGRVHGGSFMVGSATNPGLDGSALALATDSIIAVIQYRLGAVSAFTASNSCHYQLTWFL